MRRSKVRKGLGGARITSAYGIVQYSTFWNKTHMCCKGYFLLTVGTHLQPFLRRKDRKGGRVGTAGAWAWGLLRLRAASACQVTKKVDDMASPRPGPQVPWSPTGKKVKGFLLTVSSREAAVSSRVIIRWLGASVLPCSVFRVPFTVCRVPRAQQPKYLHTS